MIVISADNKADGVFKTMDAILDQLLVDTGPQASAVLRFETYLKSLKWGITGMLVMQTMAGIARVTRGNKIEPEKIIPDSSDESLDEVGIFVSHVLLAQTRAFSRVKQIQMVEVFRAALAAFETMEGRPYKYAEVIEFLCNQRKKPPEEATK